MTNHVSATRPGKAGRRPSGAKKQITLLRAAADWLLVDEVQTGLSQVISRLVTGNLGFGLARYYSVSPCQARPRDEHGLHSPSNVTLAAGVYSGRATGAVLFCTDTCVCVSGAATKVLCSLMKLVPLLLVVGLRCILDEMACVAMRPTTVFHVARLAALASR